MQKQKTQNCRLESAQVKVAVVHLYNDFSGSPVVLRGFLQTLQSNLLEPTLFIGSRSVGALSDVKVPTFVYGYKRGSSRLGVLFEFLKSQICLYTTLYRVYKAEGFDCILVNTLMPFAAAIFGKLYGIPVICYAHEVSVGPSTLTKFLCATIEHCAYKVICVSEWHKKNLNIDDEKIVVVHNGLTDNLLHSSGLIAARCRRRAPFKVLMIASKRDYKGIPEFYKLARYMEGEGDFAFQLLLNAEQTEVQLSIEQDRPRNLDIIGPRVDLSEVYASADLLVNFSRPTEWIETFGMTLLEGMAYGVPVICPRVGGPLEFVVDGIHGFHQNGVETEGIARNLRRLQSELELWNRMSSAARQQAQRFTQQEATFKVTSLLLEAVDVKNSKLPRGGDSQ